MGSKGSVDRTFDPSKVDEWRGKWRDVMAEAYCGAGLLLLREGNVEGARTLHAELTRRFPLECGRHRFLELDEALAKADARGATMKRIRDEVDDHHAEGNRPADVGGYRDAGGWTGAADSPDFLPDDDESEEIEL